MGAAIKPIAGSPPKLLPRRRRRMPAPITVRFECPRCGGAHPLEASWAGPDRGP